MIITISGEAGSGKTTIGKTLAKILNCNFYSMGDLRGRMATERGMTIDELNKLGEKEGWTDKEVDNYQKELGEKEDNFVIEGRLSWFFIPHSKKIFLYVHPEIGAKRVFANPRADEKKIKTIEEMTDYILQRRESDIKRYGKYYGINPYEQKNYDLVINTSDRSPKKIWEEILKKIL